MCPLLKGVVNLMLLDTGAATLLRRDAERLFEYHQQLLTISFAKYLLIWVIARDLDLVFFTSQKNAIAFTKQGRAIAFLLIPDSI